MKAKKKHKEDKQIESFLEEIIADVPCGENNKIMDDDKIQKVMAHIRREGKRKRNKKNYKVEGEIESVSTEILAVVPDNEKKKVIEVNEIGRSMVHIGRETKKKNGEEGKVHRVVESFSEEILVRVPDNMVGNDADRMGSKRTKKRKVMDAKRGELESCLEEIVAEVPNNGNKKNIKDNEIENDKDHIGREGKKKRKKMETLDREIESISEEIPSKMTDNEKKQNIKDNEIGKDKIHMGRESKKKVDTEIESFLEEIPAKVPLNERETTIEDNEFGKDENHLQREGKKKKKTNHETARGIDFFSKEILTKVTGYEKKKTIDGNEIEKDKVHMKQGSKSTSKKVKVGLEMESISEELLTKMRDNGKKKITEDNEIGKGVVHTRREGKKKKKDKVDVEMQSFLEEIPAKMPDNEKREILEDSVIGTYENHTRREGKRKRENEEKDKVHMKKGSKSTSKKVKVGLEMESASEELLAKMHENGKKKITEDNEIGKVMVHTRREGKKKKKDKVDVEMQSFLEEIPAKMPDNEKREILEDSVIGTYENRTRREGKRKRENEEKIEGNLKKRKNEKKGEFDVDVELVPVENISQMPASGRKTLTKDIQDAKGHTGEKKSGEDGFGVELKRGKKKMEENDTGKKIIGKDKGAAKGKDHKHVKFSSHVEVFPSDCETCFEWPPHGELVRGKRYSDQEDKMIMESISEYIQVHNLGNDGLQMVLHCNAHPEVRGCWKEIASHLPWRPRHSIYNRAHCLYQRDNSRTWSEEELDFVRRYVANHGRKWKSLANMLNKHDIHVKDAWRRIKLDGLKKGSWSQEEYRALFDLVNKDLCMKAFEEKKTKCGMIRDNISWDAISDTLGTRAPFDCCQKWYNQLVSNMVRDRLWDNLDDRRLLEGLLTLDVCCVEEVDWDALLDNRSGDICLRRWNQLVKHIGDNHSRPFPEQVELLASRYCPSLLDKGKDDEIYSDPEAELFA